ncbi:PREDICTED: cysteine proteinase inhibitor 5-like [Camelina sativa]|uniref:Cysteine proteinase inhibitor 5-like n=1 Tax=Camelina sativa TaxID=90675 RepID=A0ABM0UI06_CAMSA|nr:PREDICTED: cysteine proteinase inhibitor 5-like [Camelina sativa]
MKVISLVLLLSLALVVVPLYEVSAETRVGGWSPISDVKDPHVVEIGEFAVSEYDKRSKLGLKFETVVSGETQVVSGTNYRLTVAANDGGASKNYEAMVWEKPWLKFMNLTSFKPVNNGRRRRFL